MTQLTAASGERRRQRQAWRVWRQLLRKACNGGMTGTRPYISCVSFCGSRQTGREGKERRCFMAVVGSGEVEATCVERDRGKERGKRMENERGSEKKNQ